MKNKIKFLGLIAIVAIITLAFAACDNGGGGGKSHVHEWGAWDITTAPTCSVTGTGSRVCVSCGETDSNTTIPIAPDAHDWEWVTTPNFISEGEATRECNHNSSHTETINGPHPITNTADWTTARSQLSGKTGEYTLTIDGDVGVEGSTAETFNTAGNSTVTLKGSGRLYLTSRGNIIRASGRTVIIDSKDLTLQGLKNGENGATQDNNTSVVYVASGGRVELKNGTISGNTNANAGGGNDGGGGVIVNQVSYFTMSGGEISGNAAAGNGGGVYVYNQSATFIMDGGKISNNVNNSVYNGGGGGGVYVVSGGRFTMSGGEISGNTSNGRGDGGGVYMGGTFTMNDGEISGNTGTRGASGVHVVSGGTFTMNDGKISGNTRSSNGGGGVENSGTFIMNGGEISGNTNWSGGGVYVVSGGTFTMNDGKISNNTSSGTGSSDGGGGVLVSNGTFTMQNGEISGNTASSYGGGVYVASGGTFTMEDGKISGNTANSNGGGVYAANSGNFIMKGGEISGNTASGGGGVQKTGSGFFRIVTGTIYGSNAVDVSLRNIATNSYAAIIVSNTQRGTFTGADDAWVSKGNLSSTDDTIKVLNGDIVPYP